MNRFTPSYASWTLRAAWVAAVLVLALPASAGDGVVLVEGRPLVNGVIRGRGNREDGRVPAGRLPVDFSTRPRGDTGGGGGIRVGDAEIPTRTPSNTPTPQPTPFCEGSGPTCTPTATATPTLVATPGNENAMLFWSSYRIGYTAAAPGACPGQDCQVTQTWAFAPRLGTPVFIIDDGQTKIEATETTMPSAGMISNLTARCSLSGDINGNSYSLTGAMTVDIMVNGSPTGVYCTIFPFDGEPGTFSEFYCSDHDNEYVYAKNDAIGALLRFSNDAVVADGFCEIAAAVRAPDGIGEHDSIIRIGEVNPNAGRSNLLFPTPTGTPNTISYCGPQMTDQSDNFTRICDVTDPNLAAITIPNDSTATAFAVHFKYAFTGPLTGPVPAPAPTPGGGGTETFTWHNLTTGQDIGLSLALTTHDGPGYSVSTEHCTENCELNAGDQIVLRREHTGGTSQDNMWRHFVLELNNIGTIVTSGSEPELWDPPVNQFSTMYNSWIGEPDLQESFYSLPRSGRVRNLWVSTAATGYSAEPAYVNEPFPSFRVCAVPSLGDGPLGPECELGPQCTLVNAALGCADTATVQNADPEYLIGIRGGPLGVNVGGNWHFSYEIAGLIPTETPLVELSTPTNTATPTDTATPANTATPTVTPTPTATLDDGGPEIGTETPTSTPTDPGPPTRTPTNTATSSPTLSATPTSTATDTPTPTRSSTPTSSPSHTPTRTYTSTPTPSNTSTPTRTPTSTATRTFTNTPTSTPSSTFTVTSTFTRTPTFTSTSTFTHTPTFTNTPTRTATFTRTSTPTRTPTRTPTPEVCAGNLLLNPSFEQTSGTNSINGPIPTIWVLESGESGTTTAYDPPDGNRVGYVWNVGSTPGVLTQSVPAVAGTTYSMTYYAGTHTPSTNPTVELRFYNSSNVQVGTPMIHVLTVDIDPINALGGPYEIIATAPAGVSYMKVIMRDPSTSHAGSKADAFCLVEVETSPCDVNPNGTHIEAENPSSTGNPGATYKFAGVGTSPTGFVGSGFVSTGTTLQDQQTFDVVNANPTTYERYDYQLNFTTTGTYRVWMRGYGLSSDTDTVYIGLDGVATGALTQTLFNQWAWTSTIQNGSNQITVTTPGTHTLNVWRREINYRLDALFLSSTGATPSGGIPSGATVVSPVACANPPTPTATPTATSTPTATFTDTPTQTPTATFTNTPTRTPTSTFTRTPTRTPTSNSPQTLTPTRTPTRTPTNTFTSTPTHTRTPTNTWTPTRTATPEVCAGNLLLNPSFEQTSGTNSINGPIPTIWVLESGESGTTTAYDPPDGNRVGYVWNVGSTPGVLTQSVPAVAGTTYSMTFYAGTHTPSTNPTVELRFYNSSNVQIGTPVVHVLTVDIDPINALGGPYEIIATAPANVSYMKVIMRDLSTSRAGSKADAFCLLPVAATSCDVSSNGTYIDAERPSAIANSGATYSFAGVGTSPSGYVGSGFIASPSSNQNQQSIDHVNSNPSAYERYDYEMNFTSTGVYTIWMRGYGLDGDSDSVFVGLNGVAVGALTQTVHDQWAWTSSTQTGSNQINVTTTGSHRISVWRRETSHRLDGLFLSRTGTVPSGGIPSGAAVISAAACASCQANSQGTYVDAENPTRIVNSGATYAFGGASSTQSGYVGLGYLQAPSAPQNQQSFVHVNDASTQGQYVRYDYDLNFSTTGVYRFWIRGYAPNSNSDSLYIGLNGVAVGAITASQYNQWVWTRSIQSGANQISIPTAGTHTVSVWRRESDFRLDGFLLTKSTATPSGGIPSGATVVVPCQ